MNYGGWASGAGGAVLQILARRARAREPYAPVHQPLFRPRRRAGAPGAVLQLHGPAIDRSRVAHPNADHRLLLRHSIGTPALRIGPPKSGLPMVLRARLGGRAPWRS